MLSIASFEFSCQVIGSSPDTIPRDAGVCVGAIKLRHHYYPGHEDTDDSRLLIKRWTLNNLLP